jgi:hypothetical protein
MTSISIKAAILSLGVALAASPALAQPPQTPGDRGAEHGAGRVPTDNTSTPGPKASLPAKAKAYGRYCQSMSRKHAPGQSGTPFSRCVTAMAKLARGDSKSPRRACHDQSRRHVAGEKGTAFSRCVAGAAKLLRVADR